MTCDTFTSDKNWQVSGEFGNPCEPLTHPTDKICQENKDKHIDLLTDMIFFVNDRDKRVRWIHPNRR